MKNKTLVLNRSNQAKAPDWLFPEEQEDDFLIGKIPGEFMDTWEDEE